MPCTCEGYPEPTLLEQVTKVFNDYENLVRCHAQVVAERDALKEENTKLKAAYGDLKFRMDGLEK